MRRRRLFFRGWGLFNNGVGAISVVMLISLRGTRGIGAANKGRVGCAGVMGETTAVGIGTALHVLVCVLFLRGPESLPHPAARALMAGVSLKFRYHLRGRLRAPAPFSLEPLL